MIDSFRSEEGEEVSVYRLEKSVVITVGNKEITLSTSTADSLADSLREEEPSPISGREFFYH